MDGNILATLAFIAVVPVALLVSWRYRASVAVASLMVGAALLLPELVEFKLPGLPSFTKIHIATLWVLLGAIVFHRQKLRRLKVSGVVWICVILLPLTAVGTALTNGDLLHFGPRVVDALGPYDAVHFIVDDLFQIVLPFFLGLIFFRSYASLRDLLVVWVVAALVYTIPILVEIRLSPQLHNWVYGFHQHDFAQTMRGGGFRPMVFMSHGLALSLFVAAAAIAATALYRAKERLRTYRAIWAAGYLTVVLVLCKSLGALLYGMLCLPAVFFLKVKHQLRIAVAMTLLVSAYPALQAAGAFPDEAIVDAAREYAGEDRAGSAEFRFVNENLLVERAGERLLFGWGGFCRGCIFDQWSGDELSVRDGEWIILLGDRGIVATAAQFGLLLYPVFLCWRRVRRVRNRKTQTLLAGTALILAIYTADLLPNGLYNYLPFLLAGALLSTLTDELRSQRRHRGPKARRGRQPERAPGVPQHGPRGSNQV
ncbi:MAG: hypothetical protein AAGF12_21585 [Myxococcota bacterium]